MPFRYITSFSRHIKFSVVCIVTVEKHFFFIHKHDFCIAVLEFYNISYFQTSSILSVKLLVLFQSEQTEDSSSLCLNYSATVRAIHYV